MRFFFIKEIVEITGGKLQQGLDNVAVAGVSINSRTLKAGDLFIAIQGQRLDGHKFVAKALKQGAAAIVVSKNIKGVPSHVPVVLVKDTTLALGHLARAYRDRFSIPVVAITGSAGKTTTKEFVAAVLQSRFNVHKNIGTENNQIGVPMTIFKLTPKHEVLVLEVGTNRFGDIPWLTYVAHPTAAIFTNVGESHLALLKSPADVLREKFALAKGTQTGGPVIVNVDNKYLRGAIKNARKQKIITYGIEQKANYQAGKICGQSQKLSFVVNGKQKVILNSPIAANVYNALAAISCGRIFNIPYNVINRSIKRVVVSGGRQAIEKCGEIWVINDTYNANPVSFRSALQTLTTFASRGRKILVCADMLELGRRAKPLHQDMGTLAASLGVDAVFAFGHLTKFLVQAAQKENPEIRAQFFASLPKLHQRLKSFIHSGDVVLVKGSRGMHLERTVEYLRKM